MQVIDNPKEDAQIPIVQNGTNYSMPFGTLYKLLIQISENSDILKQVSDAATEVACRLAALTDAENNISEAEEQREVSMRNALEDIAEASGKAEDTAAHPGYVDNDGYYYKWNVETRTYEKTDVNLKGDAFRYEDFTPEQVSALRAPATDAAAEVARRLTELTDEENDMATAEAQREASVRNALEDIAEASGKADAAAEAANTAAANVKDGKSAYQIYYDTTTDNPKLTEAQWGNLMTGILNVLNSI